MPGIEITNAANRLRQTRNILSTSWQTMKTMAQAGKLSRLEMCAWNKAQDDQISMELLIYHTIRREDPNAELPTPDELQKKQQIGRFAALDCGDGLSGLFTRRSMSSGGLSDLGAWPVAVIWLVGIVIVAAIGGLVLSDLSGDQLEAQEKRVQEIRVRAEINKACIEQTGKPCIGSDVPISPKPFDDLLGTAKTVLTVATIGGLLYVGLKAYQAIRK